MKENTISKLISRYIALFLLSLFFTQHTLICINTSVESPPKQTETSVAFQVNDKTAADHPCIIKMDCAFHCHLVTINASTQKKRVVLAESKQITPGYFSSNAVLKAVFRPPRLFVFT